MYVSPPTSNRHRAKRPRDEAKFISHPFVRLSATAPLGSRPSSARARTHCRFRIGLNLQSCDLMLHAMNEGLMRSVSTPITIRLVEDSDGRNVLLT